MKVRNPSFRTEQELVLTIFNIVSELPTDVFNKINALDQQRRYNFPARLGVNIFGEATQEQLDEAVRVWKAAQKASK